MSSTTITNRTRSIWRSRLGSSFRTGFACAIVGCITLFGPLSVQQMIAFPALTYVTVILIVSEATLGDTLRGGWYAICGTLQGVLPSLLALWMLGNARFSIVTIFFAVTLTTFFILLPESTHMIAKRVALAQTVLLYSVTSVHGVKTGTLLHPAHVAVSTGVGAFAAVVALLLPFPRLACHEVRKKCNLMKENATERLNLYVKAFSAENTTAALAFLSQAKYLSQTGNSLLQSIKLKQESMQWEIPQFRSSQLQYMRTIDRLQTLEIPLRGMEIALTSSPSFPVRVADQELTNLLLCLKENLTATLEHCNCSPESDSSIVSETKKQIVEISLQTMQLISPTRNDLPSLFFLFCVTLLQNESSPEEPVSLRKQEKFIAAMLSGDWKMKISKERLTFAFKCSLSLGLAVFFGIIFSKENGFWSGLTVAVGMAFGREASFTIANLKAQGTVLGTIYGLLSCFLFQRFLEIRFFSLLPWIIFTSFLRSSRMYGPAGAMSAVIAALIVLGRKDYGPPSEFAIVRIVEAFIGLTCSIMIELILQPTRASTLSKVQLTQSLGMLHDCIQSISLHFSNGNKQTLCPVASKEKLKKLQTQLNALRKLTREAEIEPNFWFIPFYTNCYGKLHRSLSEMLELLSFATNAMEFLTRESNRIGASWKAQQESLNGDLDHFKKIVSSSIKCLKEIAMVNSLAAVEKELIRRDITCDLELGELPIPNGYRGMNVDEDETEKMTSSYLQHSREVIDKLQASEVEKNLQSQMALSLIALGFCMHGLMKETKELEKSVKDLIQWENPSTRVNLSEIHYKIKALNT